MGNFIARLAVGAVATGVIWAVIRGQDHLRYRKHIKTASNRLDSVDAIDASKAAKV